MRYLFILNPGSKGGKSEKKFERLFEILDSEGIDYDYKITSTLDEAFDLSLQANRSSYDVIVAVGGDGTINKVLNGFFDAQGNRLSNARMGVVYTGTSPDFCKSYCIPIELEAALNVLLRNKSSKIQIGRVCLANNYSNEYDDRPVDDSTHFHIRYFACCANIGLGAELARLANSGIRKKWGDFFGTLLSLGRILTSYKPQDFTLCINTELTHPKSPVSVGDGCQRVVKSSMDSTNIQLGLNPPLNEVSFNGAKKRIEKVHNISIGRTFYIASGIKVKNTLKQGDNSFYMLTVKNLRVKDWIKAIKAIYSGKQIKNDDIVSLDYIKSIEVYGNRLSPEVEFDGDPAGFLPCRIEMAKDTLDLICGIDETCEGYCEYRKKHH